MTKKAKSWTFYSRHKNLQLWLKQPVETYDARGKLRVIDPGIMVEFEGGHYSTTDPVIAEALMKHPGFGLDFELFKGEAPSAEELKENALTAIKKSIEAGPPTGDVIPKEKVRRVYRCKECGATFTSVYHLTKHKREAHPVIAEEIVEKTEEE